MFNASQGTEAFALISTAFNEEKKVLEKLRQVKELTEAHNVRGTYDILAKFKTKSQEDMSELMNGRIKKIEGVKGTRILLLA